MQPVLTPGAAEELAFDESYFLSGSGEASGERRASLSGTNDDCVEVGHNAGHTSSLNAA